jgi:hypothetical protein
MYIHSDECIPVEVVFSPDWWHANYGISFGRDFFFDPERRVSDEREMRRALFDRFGDIGLGEQNAIARPVIGAVHLASGYFVAEALGCEVKYHLAAPPDVLPMNLDDDRMKTWQPPVLSETAAMRDLQNIVNTLKARFGSVEGDINWSGVHNTALNIRGNALLMDYYDRPDTVKRFLDAICEFIFGFVKYLDSESGTSSISVNRSVGKFNPKLHLHSNCSITMISNEVYEEFLLPSEQKLASRLQPYGIHHCGVDMHRLASSYARVEGVEFYDVGWESDAAKCRQLLPKAFFNIRLSPAKFATCSPEEVASDVHRLAAAAGPLDQLGFCCINIDSAVPDENIRALFETVCDIRKKGSAKR